MLSTFIVRMLAAGDSTTLGSADATAVSAYARHRPVPTVLSGMVAVGGRLMVDVDACGGGAPAGRAGITVTGGSGAVTYSCAGMGCSHWWHNKRNGSHGGLCRRLDHGLPLVGALDCECLQPYPVSCCLAGRDAGGHGCGKAGGQPGSPCCPYPSPRMTFSAVPCRVPVEGLHLACCSRRLPCGCGSRVSIPIASNFVSQFR